MARRRRGADRHVTRTESFEDRFGWSGSTRRVSGLRFDDTSRDLGARWLRAATPEARARVEEQARRTFSRRSAEREEKALRSPGRPTEKGRFLSRVFLLKPEDAGISVRTLYRWRREARGTTSSRPGPAPRVFTFRGRTGTAAELASVFGVTESAVRRASKVAA